MPKFCPFTFDALPAPANIVLKKQGNSNLYELYHGADPISIRVTGPVPLTVDRAYDQDGLSTETGSQLTLNESHKVTLQTIIETATTARFPDTALKSYAFKDDNLKIKITHKEKTSLITRAFVTDSGVCNKKLRHAQSGADSVRDNLFGKTVVANDVIFKLCFFKFEDSEEVVCSVRMQVLNFATLDDIASVPITDQSTISYRPSVGFIESEENGASSIVLRVASEDKLRVAVFEPTPGDSKYGNKTSVLISLPDNVGERLHAQCADMASSPDFINPFVKKDDKYGWQMKTNYTTLPDFLPGSCSTDRVEFTVHFYTFVNDTGQALEGARVNLIRVGECSDAAKSSGGGGGTAFVDLDALTEDDIVWEPGKSEGTYVAKIGADGGGTVSLQPDDQHSVISNPELPEELVQNVDGKLRKALSDEPIDMFIEPQELHGCDQRKFLQTLENSARNHCNSLYNTAYGQDAPWQDVNPAEENVKLKIKSQTVPTLDPDGNKISIEDVVCNHGKFKAKVSVFPRIYAPHLKSGMIKKGKKALKNNKAILTLQLTHLAMVDEVRNALGNDLEQALGYAVSDF